MATLGRIWQQTVEHARTELYALMYKQPLVLPEEEFEFFKSYLLQRIHTLLQVYTTRPMINNPSVKFLWVLFNRLDPEQREAIRDLDSRDVLFDWERQMIVHPLANNHMMDYRNWGCYYSTEKYLEYVRNITNQDYYDLQPASVTSQIFIEFAHDPRRAYFNGEAIQWTGDNRGDIELYYGKQFNTSFNNGDLIIHTGTGDHRLKLGDWTWPDAADGIDSGDHVYILKRRLDTGLPGLWIKPGSKSITSTNTEL